MTAAELRIGNWVILQQDDNGIQRYNHDVDAIDIAVAVDNPERFSPIPLSPELLEAMGFEERQESWEHPNISLGKPNLNLCTAYGEYTVSFKKNTYLHQLQNLFYSLTGEELSIDLNNVPSTNK